MNFVEPIRDPQTVENICNYLKERNQRDYVMVMLGFYTALRISDILLLKVKDVSGKRQISLREKKTQKQKLIEINPILKKALEEYVIGKKPDEFLIKSSRAYNKPISRTVAYKIIKNTAKEFDLDNIGTHTLRKTFGYHYYKRKKDVVQLQKILNHSHPSITLRYIGIEQDSINDTYRDFRY